MLSRPQGRIIDVKCETSAIIKLVRELVTSNMHIWEGQGPHDKLFKLSRPQVNVNADTDADADDAKL